MSMTVLDAIRQRRATRIYTDRRVDAETVNALLDAAVRAPSARNQQPWSFAIIQDRRVLTALSTEIKAALADDPQWREALPLADRDFDIFYGAGTLIVICAETGGFSPVGDCYLAAENLMLAAYSMGLATCPIGLARDVLQADHWRKQLQVPTDVTPVLPLIAGYAGAVMPPTSRRPPVITAWIR